MAVGLPHTSLLFDSFKGPIRQPTGPFAINGGFRNKSATGVSQQTRRLKVSAHNTKAVCELSEAKAVHLAQRGDAGAFERLYRLHSARVYALCRRMLKNAEEAEDLSQEVFLCVFRRIRTFRGDSAFSTWLHRVTVNTVLMRLREKKTRTSSVAEWGTHGDPDERTRPELGAPDQRLEGYADRATLERAIEKLPPGCKMMFELYDVHGYAHREIAKIAGCSVGNAKSQLHKARLRLRQLLADYRGGGQAEAISALPG